MSRAGAVAGTRGTRPGPLQAGVWAAVAGVAAFIVAVAAGAGQAAQTRPSQEGTASTPGAAGGLVLVLEARVFPAGPVLFEVPLEEPEFAVTFRHSVEKTVVVERFRVGPEAGMFTLYRTEYLSFGAGLPAEGRLEVQPQGPVLVMELERPIQKLVFRVSRMTEHRLLAGGCSFDLSGAVTDGGAAVELVASFDRPSGQAPCEQGAGTTQHGGGADGHEQG